MTLRRDGQQLLHSGQLSPSKAALDASRSKISNSCEQAFESFGYPAQGLASRGSWKAKV